MVVFTYTQKDFVSWQHAFAKQLNIAVSGEDLIIPASLGQGRIFAHNFGRDLSLVVMDCTLSDDLRLIRKASGSEAILLFFNQVSISSFIRIKSGHEELIESTKSRNNIFLSSTNMELEVDFPKGSVLKRVGIYFSPAMVRNFVRKDMQMLLTLYTGRGIKNVNREIINFELKSILDEIFQTNISSDFGRLILQNRVLLLTEKFLHHLLAKEIKNDKKPLIRDEDISRIKEVEKVLTRTDLNKFPSIETLSRMAMMSSTKLKIKFKEVYGMKLYEYYNRHRLQKAKEIIASHKSSVKEAAYSAGFSNLSNFSRAFKKEFGILPGQLK